MKAALKGLILLFACAGAWAQPADDVPGEIRQQRERLSQERSQINQAHELQAKACWQKFAVNDCLAAVRKSKRAQLDPIHQQELQLNAQERAWRTQQREERLQNKAAEGARSEQ
jgi:small-conductance mechanosensitive channel